MDQQRSYAPVDYTEEVTAPDPATLIRRSQAARLGTGGTGGAGNRPTPPSSPAAGGLSFDGNNNNHNNNSAGVSGGPRPQSANIPRNPRKTLLSKQPRPANVLSMQELQKTIKSKDQQNNKNAHSSADDTDSQADDACTTKRDRSERVIRGGARMDGDDDDDGDNDDDERRRSKSGGGAHQPAANAPTVYDLSLMSPRAVIDSAITAKEATQFTVLLQPFRNTSLQGRASMHVDSVGGIVVNHADLHTGNKARVTSGGKTRTQSSTHIPGGDAGMMHLGTVSGAHPLHARFSVDRGAPPGTVLGATAAVVCPSDEANFVMFIHDTQSKLCLTLNFKVLLKEERRATVQKDMQDLRDALELAKRHGEDIRAQLARTANERDRALDRIRDVEIDVQRLTAERNRLSTKERAIEQDYERLREAEQRLTQQRQREEEQEQEMQAARARERDAMKQRELERQQIKQAEQERAREREAERKAIEAERFRMNTERIQYAKDRQAFQTFMKQVDAERAAFQEREQQWRSSIQSAMSDVAVCEACVSRKELEKNVQLAIQRVKEMETERDKMAAELKRVVDAEAARLSSALSLGTRIPRKFAMFSGSCETLFPLANTQLSFRGAVHRGRIFVMVHPKNIMKRAGSSMVVHPAMAVTGASSSHHRLAPTTSTSSSVVDQLLAAATAAVATAGDSDGDNDVDERDPPDDSVLTHQEHGHVNGNEGPTQKESNIRCIVGFRGGNSGHHVLTTLNAEDPFADDLTANYHWSSSYGATPISSYYNETEAPPKLLRLNVEPLPGSRSPYRRSGAGAGGGAGDDVFEDAGESKSAEAGGTPETTNLDAGSSSMHGAPSNVRELARRVVLGWNMMKTRQEFLGEVPLSGKVTSSRKNSVLFPSSQQHHQSSSTSKTPSSSSAAAAAAGGKSKSSQQAQSSGGADHPPPPRSASYISTATFEHIMSGLQGLQGWSIGNGPQPTALLLNATPILESFIPEGSQVLCFELAPGGTLAATGVSHLLKHLTLMACQPVVSESAKTLMTTEVEHQNKNMKGVVHAAPIDLKIRLATCLEVMDEVDNLAHPLERVEELSGRLLPTPVHVSKQQQQEKAATSQAVAGADNNNTTTTTTTAEAELESTSKMPSSPPQETTTNIWSAPGDSAVMNHAAAGTSVNVLYDAKCERDDRKDSIAGAFPFCDGGRHADQKKLSSLLDQYDSGTTSGVVVADENKQSPTKKANKDDSSSSSYSDSDATDDDERGEGSFSSRDQQQADASAADKWQRRFRYMQVQLRGDGQPRSGTVGEIALAPSVFDHVSGHVFLTVKRSSKTNRGEFVSVRRRVGRVIYGNVDGITYDDRGPKRSKSTLRNWSRVRNTVGAADAFGLEKTLSMDASTSNNNNTLLMSQSAAGSMRLSKSMSMALARNASSVQLFRGVGGDRNAIDRENGDFEDIKYCVIEFDNDEEAEADVEGDGGDKAKAGRSLSWSELEQLRDAVGFSVTDPADDALSVASAKSSSNTKRRRSTLGGSGSPKAKPVRTGTRLLHVTFSGIVVYDPLEEFNADGLAAGDDFLSDDEGDEVQGIDNLDDIDFSSSSHHNTPNRRRKQHATRKGSGGSSSSLPRKTSSSLGHQGGSNSPNSAAAKQHKKQQQISFNTSSGLFVSSSMNTAAGVGASAVQESPDEELQRQIIQRQPRQLRFSFGAHVAVTNSRSLISVHPGTLSATFRSGVRCNKGLVSDTPASGVFLLPRFSIQHVLPCCPLPAKLTVSMASVALDQLYFDLSAGSLTVVPNCRCEDGEERTIILHRRCQVGVVTAQQNERLQIALNGLATASVVQEVVRAISFRAGNVSSGSAASVARSVNVEMSVFGRTQWSDTMLLSGVSPLLSFPFDVPLSRTEGESVSSPLFSLPQNALQVPPEIEVLTNRACLAVVVDIMPASSGSSSSSSSPTTTATTKITKAATAVPVQINMSRETLMSSGLAVKSCRATNGDWPIQWMRRAAATATLEQATGDAKWINERISTCLAAAAASSGGGGGGGLDISSVVETFDLAASANQTSFANDDEVRVVENSTGLIRVGSVAFVGTGTVIMVFPSAAANWLDGQMLELLQSGIVPIDMDVTPNVKASHIQGALRSISAAVYSSLASASQCICSVRFLTEGPTSAIMAAHASAAAAHVMASSASSQQQQTSSGAPSSPTDAAENGVGGGGSPTEGSPVSSEFGGGGGGGMLTVSRHLQDTMPTTDSVAEQQCLRAVRILQSAGSIPRGRTIPTALHSFASLLYVHAASTLTKLDGVDSWVRGRFTAPPLSHGRASIAPRATLVQAPLSWSRGIVTVTVDIDSQQLPAGYIAAIVVSSEAKALGSIPLQQQSNNTSSSSTGDQQNYDSSSATRRRSSAAFGGDASAAADAANRKRPWHKLGVVRAVPEWETLLKMSKQSPKIFSVKPSLARRVAQQQQLFVEAPQQQNKQQQQQGRKQDQQPGEEYVDATADIISSFPSSSYSPSSGTTTEEMLCFNGRAVGTIVRRDDNVVNALLMQQQQQNPQQPASPTTTTLPSSSAPKSTLTSVSSGTYRSGRRGSKTTTTATTATTTSKPGTPQQVSIDPLFDGAGPRPTSASSRGSGGGAGTTSPAESSQSVLPRVVVPPLFVATMTKVSAADVSNFVQSLQLVVMKLKPLPTTAGSTSSAFAPSDLVEQVQQQHDARIVLPTPTQVKINIQCKPAAVDTATQHAAVAASASVSSSSSPCSSMASSANQAAWNVNLKSSMQVAWHAPPLSFDSGEAVPRYLFAKVPQSAQSSMLAYQLSPFALFRRMHVGNFGLMHTNPNQPLDVSEATLPHGASVTVEVMPSMSPEAVQTSKIECSFDMTAATADMGSSRNAFSLVPHADSVLASEKGGSGAGAQQQQQQQPSSPLYGGASKSSSAQQPLRHGALYSGRTCVAEYDNVDGTSMTLEQHKNNMRTKMMSSVLRSTQISVEVITAPSSLSNKRKGASETDSSPPSAAASTGRRKSIGKADKPSLLPSSSTVCVTFRDDVVGVIESYFLELFWGMTVNTPIGCPFTIVSVPRRRLQMAAPTTSGLGAGAAAGSHHHRESDATISSLGGTTTMRSASIAGGFGLSSSSSWNTAPNVFLLVGATEAARVGSDLFVAWSGTSGADASDAPPSPTMMLDDSMSGGGGGDGRRKLPRVFVEWAHGSARAGAGTMRESSVVGEGGSTVSSSAAGWASSVDRGIYLRPCELSLAAPGGGGGGRGGGGGDQQQQDGDSGLDDDEDGGQQDYDWDDDHVGRRHRHHDDDGVSPTTDEDDANSSNGSTDEPHTPSPAVLAAKKRAALIKSQSALWQRPQHRMPLPVAFRRDSIRGALVPAATFASESATTSLPAHWQWKWASTSSSSQHQQQQNGGAGGSSSPSGGEDPQIVERVLYLVTGIDPEPCTAPIARVLRESQVKVVLVIDEIELASLISYLCELRLIRIDSDAVPLDLPLSSRVVKLFISSVIESFLRLAAAEARPAGTGEAFNVERLADPSIEPVLRGLGHLQFGVVLPDLAGGGSPLPSSPRGGGGGSSVVAATLCKRDVVADITADPRGAAEAFGLANALMKSSPLNGPSSTSSSTQQQQNATAAAGKRSSSSSVAFSSGNKLLPSHNYFSSKPRDLYLSQVSWDTPLVAPFSMHMKPGHAFDLVKKLPNYLSAVTVKFAFALVGGPQQQTLENSVFVQMSKGSGSRGGAQQQQQPQQSSLSGTTGHHYSPYYSTADDEPQQGRQQQQQQQQTSSSSVAAMPHFMLRWGFVNEIVSEDEATNLHDLNALEIFQVDDASVASATQQLQQQQHHGGSAHGGAVRRDSAAAKSSSDLMSSAQQQAMSSNKDDSGNISPEASSGAIDRYKATVAEELMALHTLASDGAAPEYSPGFLVDEDYGTPLCPSTLSSPPFFAITQQVTSKIIAAGRLRIRSVSQIQSRTEEQHEQGGPQQQGKTSSPSSSQQYQSMYGGSTSSPRRSKNRSSSASAQKISNVSDSELVIVFRDGFRVTRRILERLLGRVALFANSGFAGAGGQQLSEVSSSSASSSSPARRVRISPSTSGAGGKTGPGDGGGGSGGGDPNAFQLMCTCSVIDRAHDVVLAKVDIDPLHLHV